MEYGCTFQAQKLMSRCKFIFICAHQRSSLSAPGCSLGNDFKLQSVTMVWSSWSGEEHLGVAKELSSQEKLIQSYSIYFNLVKMVCECHYPADQSGPKHLTKDTLEAVSSLRRGNSFMKKNMECKQGAIEDGTRNIERYFPHMYIYIYTVCTISIYVYGQHQ